MKIYLATLFSLFSFGSIVGVPAEQALNQLKEGNTRYVEDKLVHGDRSRDRREDTAAGQNPFAVLLGCSDSRVSPSIVFDQGIGDLFVVRVAGNVFGPTEMDSIDYGVLALGAKLVVVMGHENCGAVKAVLAGQTAPIKTIASMIAPALSPKEENVSSAIKANVRYVVNQIKKSSALSKLVQEDKIKVVGAYYNLASGKVDFLE